MSMRNLKRYLAATIATAMLFVMIVPAMASSADNYATEADKLNTLGLYKGISPDGPFNPDLSSTLNRQTGATMLLRMFGLEDEAMATDLTEAKATLKDKFTDASQIADWAAKQVAYAVQAGVIKGFDNGTFQPNGLLTGKQYAAMTLQKLGYSSGWTFDEAGAKFAEVAKLDSAEAASFGTSGPIKKSTLVGISFKTLTTNLAGTSTTLIDSLIKNGDVIAAKAVEVGLATATPAATATPVVTPSTVPTATYTSVAPAVYGSVTVTGETGRSVAKNEALVKVATIKVDAVQDLNVTGVKVSRTGLSQDNDISGIVVYDGATKLNTSAIFGNAVASFDFSTNANVAKDTSKVLTLYVSMDLANSNAGNQFSVVVNEVRVNGNVTLSGNLPVTSGVFTETDTQVGSVTLAAGSGNPAAKTIDLGVKDVLLQKYKLTANSEAADVKSITFTQNGSASASDVTNLTLYKGTEKVAGPINFGTKVADKLTFEFTNPISIDNGSNVDLTLKGDIVSGSTKTIKFELNNDDDLFAVGKTYGQNIKANTTYIAATLMTIGGGSEAKLSASRASTNPSSGTINSNVNDYNFGEFTLEATGEGQQLRTIQLTAAVGAGAAVGDIKDVKLYSGNDVIGTNFDALTGVNTTITLSKLITVNPGSPVNVKITADIPTAAAAVAGDIYTLGLGNITGKTTISGKDVTTNVGIVGNAMTVGDIKVKATRTSRENIYAVKNASNVLLAEYTLEHNLGETVEISSLTINYADASGAGNANTGAFNANFNNAKLVDAAGAPLTDTIASGSLPTGAISGDYSFTLNKSIILKAGEKYVVKLLANVTASPTNNDDYTFGLVASSNQAVSNSGSNVSIEALAAGGTIVRVSTGVTSNAVLTVTDSTKSAFESGNTSRGAKDVQIGAFTFANSGSEGVGVGKLIIKNTGTLEAAYYKNIRLVSEDGKMVYGSTGSMSSDTGSTFITLVNPILVKPQSVAATPVAGTAGKTDVKVIADIDSEATYGGTIVLRYGDNVNTAGVFDVEFKSEFTGNALVNTNDTALSSRTVTVTNGAVTIEKASVLDTSPASYAAGTEVGRFKIKNGGSEAIEVTNLKLDELIGNGANFSSVNNTVSDLVLYLNDEGYNISSAVTINSNSNTFTIDADGTVGAPTSKLRINPGATKEIIVKLSTVGAGVNNSGVSVQLRVLGETSVYNVVDDSASLSFENNVSLDTVTRD